jgi:glycosyltransferase involved in cell wall biosynthesis
MIRHFQNSIVELSLSQWIFIGMFFFVFILRFVYLFLFTARVIFQKKSKLKVEANVPFSLFLTLRNEEDRIRKLLPTLLEFEGLDFEVVVVDDFSQDNSLSVLGLLNQRYERLKISSLSQETRFSVKLAQNIALKSASNDWVLHVPILLSEAKPEWLQHFSDIAGKDGVDVIVAYSTVSQGKGLFNLLYRIENFNQQIQSAAFICNGIPFVYSEDNLAFRKKKYFEIGGHGKNMRESYANLELVVNAFIKKRNTVISFNQESSIRENVQIRKRDYFDLLKKRYRIEMHLPVWKKLLLHLNTFTQLLFLPFAVFALSFVFQLWPLVAIFTTIYTIAYLLIIKITQNRLNERKIFISSLVYGLLMPYCKMFYRWHFNENSRKQRWRIKA